MEKNKVLPYSIDAEKSVLGCILNSVDGFIKVQSILKSSDFYLDKHKIIFETANLIFKSGTKLDIVTILEKLKDRGLLKKCDGATYITEIATGFFSIQNVTSYADIVKEKSYRRNLITMSRNLFQKAYDDCDLQDIIDMASSEIYNLEINSNVEETLSMDVAIEDALNNIEERYRQGGKIVGISTGFKSLDDITSGLKNGEFTVIAARPSMGKTALALNIGQAVSKKHTVAIFSIEMNRNQLMDRILSSKCLVKLKKILNGNLDDDEFNKIALGASDLMVRKLIIDDSTSMIGDIKAKCRKLKAQNNLEVVIIDYLQLIRTNLNKNSREQEVSYISREIKALAKELDINIIALSQLSRAPEQRANHRPILSDIRESGSIEQDADIIHFLYRDEYYNKDSNLKNVAEIITAKNRNGETKTTKIGWIGEYQRFAEMNG